MIRSVSTEMDRQEDAHGQRAGWMGAGAEVTSEFVSMFRHAQHTAGSTN